VIGIAAERSSVSARPVTNAIVRSDLLRDALVAESKAQADRAGNWHLPMQAPATRRGGTEQSCERG
jgi:hypothetical protein